MFFISQTPISLPSDSSALSYFFAFLFFVSVCLSAICSAWRECLALEETGVSLCVRNLTAQITWHNETWQVTAAVQKLTVKSERYWKWVERDNVSNVHYCLNECVSVCACISWCFSIIVCIVCACMCLLLLTACAWTKLLAYKQDVRSRVVYMCMCLWAFHNLTELSAAAAAAVFNPFHSWTSHLIKKRQGGWG